MMKMETEKTKTGMLGFQQGTFKCIVDLPDSTKISDLLKMQQPLKAKMVRR